MEDGKSLLSLGKKIIITKIGIAGLLIAFYTGYRNHEVISRIERNMLQRDIKVEEGYFPDPEGLRIFYDINDKGKEEIYLLHAPSGKKIPILYDMLPENSLMLEGLMSRTGRMPKDEAKKTLDSVNELEKMLYRRF